MQYSYDKNRNVTSMLDVTGKQVRYAYDAMNRLKRVEDVERGAELAGYRYTAFGRIETLEYGNGIKSEYQYGEDGNLSSLVTVTPKGEVLLNYEYAYDGNGNCTKKSGEHYRNEYVYDRMNRLTEAAYDGSREYYTYDLAGNRLKKETGKEKESYIYNARNQLLRLEKGAEVTDYYYDAQGNLLEESGNGRKKYTFDALNRLSSVATDSIAQKNHYDGESLRYEVEENDKVIRFVFDRGELSAEENAGQKIRYIHGNDNVVCSERKGEDAEYHICDEAGSTLFILDREKNIRKTYRYDAFGKLLEERGDIENHLTYTGQMYDGATGQYYLRARFYNP
ncbi:RHS repeat domain-containing protein, partial [Blautia sp.]|uniref:RHS repeat domain-containing protein n=1 Tax=Blautia sp. TaxID=1955243 RepID=UPI002F3F7133